MHGAPVKTAKLLTYVLFGFITTKESVRSHFLKSPRGLPGISELVVSAVTAVNLIRSCIMMSKVCIPDIYPY